MPDLTTIGGRLKVERERLRLTQSAMAVAGGVSRRAICNWEQGDSHPTSDVLAAFAVAGVDALFVVTGQRVPGESTSPQGLHGVTVRQALAMLDTVDRRRLLLDLLSDEMRA